MMKLYSVFWIVAGILVSTSLFAYSAPVEMREQPQVAFAQPFSPNETGEMPAISEPLSPSQQSVHREEGPVGANRLDKLEQLSEEVRQLRGLVEMQQHVIGQLQSTQLRQFQDLDQRLAALAISANKSRENHSFFRRKPVDSTESTQVAAQPKAEIASGKQVLDQQRLYESAYSHLKNKEFPQAKPILKEYLQHYPTGQYAVNAHYWLGELFLLSGETQQAKTEFARVVSDYPSSSKMADAMLKLGFIYADEGQSRAARKQFLKIKELYPNSATAKLADQRLSRIEEMG